MNLISILYTFSYEIGLIFDKKKKVLIVIDVNMKGNNESDFNPIILFPFFLFD